MATKGRASPSGPVIEDKVVVLAFNPASVAAAITAEQSVTVPGVRTTDTILAVTPGAALTAGLAIVGARVTAANTVAVQFANVTAGAIDNAAVDLTFTVGRFSN